MGSPHMLRAVTAVVVALLAPAITGCGEAGGGGDDPASLVPAGAGVYVEVTVRPDGNLRKDALAAAGKLLRTDDPGGRLRELFEQTLDGRWTGADWRRDFAPWVGERAGLWVAGLEQGEPSVALIVANEDRAAAAAALTRLDKADGKPAARRSYAGVTYFVAGDGLAVGQVGDFVVIGTGEAFRQTLEARSGDHLDGVARYRDAIDELPDDRLGHYYVDAKPLIDAVLRQGPQASLGLREVIALFPIERLGPLVGDLAADADGMAIDSTLTGIPEGSLRELARLWSGGRASLLRDLPSDSWGAFATPDVGESARAMFASFERVFGGAVFSADLRRQTGLDPRRDFFRWVGQAGGFLRGTDVNRPDWAVVIEVTEDRRAAAAMRTFVRALRPLNASTRRVSITGAQVAFAVTEHRGAPPAIVARRPGRVVLGLGPAVAAVLRPAATLGSGGAYARARDALGDGLEPSGLLSMGGLLAAVDESRSLRRELGEIRRYLQTLDIVAVGGAAEGDRMRSRIVAAFK